MHTIYIYFGYSYRAISYGIRWVTRSHFSHVEVQIDGECYSSSGSLGVYKRSYEKLRKSQDVLETWVTQINDQQKAALIDFLIRQWGKKYDYISALGLGLWRRNWLNDHNKWFCSELIDAAFKSAQAPLTNNDFASHRLTPNDLRTSLAIKREKVEKNIHNKAWWRKLILFG
ncbi:hypothetical protein [Fastidiosibacter lacustris]|uniref:hypothetical protein n=1 Tax=Fastidiosibacter lacustris TaxID=2056695 RepID=UPI000E356AA6|nr:hypothetical protein [Fastidiosibacter lacustris]